jgi:hypothetical protein
MAPPIRCLALIPKTISFQLGYDLTAEEWRTLQSGEIPTDPDAVGVIRQTTQEAEGETKDPMFDAPDRIMDGPPSQEEQARHWMEQHETL